MVGAYFPAAARDRASIDVLIGCFHPDRVAAKGSEAPSTIGKLGDWAQRSCHEDIQSSYQHKPLRAPVPLIQFSAPSDKCSTRDIVRVAHLFRDAYCTQSVHHRLARVVPSWTDASSHSNPFKATA